MQEITKNMLEQELKEIREDFLEDLKNHLVTINKNIVSLEEAFDADLMRSSYRTLHGIKGMAGTLGFPEISKIAHRIEDVFAVYLEKEKSFPSGAVSLIFKYMDAMESLKDSRPTTKEAEAKNHKILEKTLEETKTKKYQVLLIERSKALKNFIKKALEADGLEVLIAHDPLEGLNRLLSEPIDFLITSRAYYSLDGLNLIRMLKAHQIKKKIKTILLTSNENIKETEPDVVIIKHKDFMPKILKFIKACSI